VQALQTMHECADVRPNRLGSESGTAHPTTDAAMHPWPRPWRSTLSPPGRPAGIEDPVRTGVSFSVFTIQEEGYAGL
jgi:hypothetical protein